MGSRVLVIDNYDSFVYNLVQELGELGAEPIVHRNDRIDIDGIRSLSPDAILISPGPGRPENAGISQAVLSELSGEYPILGVCLGHQAIGQVFGGDVIAAPSLMHGKTSAIEHHGAGVFAGLPQPFVATRYHSLVVDPSTLPDVLEITASTSDGVIMGIRHRTLPIEGVQFHPESILTPNGPSLLSNFLATAHRS
jgi:anthranilate synthase component II